MHKRELLASENEKFILMMHENGNLVLSYNNQNRQLWQSNTTRIGDRLVMKESGNLVIYDNDNKIIWQLDTGGRGEYAQLENDANLVVYDSNGIAVWSTKIDLS